jgi:hypothetical protein
VLFKASRVLIAVALLLGVLEPLRRTAVPIQMQKTTAPRKGNIDYDITGTASGKWWWWQYSVGNPQQLLLNVVAGKPTPAKLTAEDKC